MTALLFVGVFAADFIWPVRHYGTTADVTAALAANWPVFLLHLWLFASLLAASAIDLEHTVIPAPITNLGMGLGLMVSLIAPQTQPSRLPFAAGWPAPLAAGLDSLIGLAVGFSLCWLTRVLGTWAFKKEALGRGDLHLMGMVGAAFGWEVAVLGFFIGPFFGLLMVVIGMIADRRGGPPRQIPFGPGLSLGSAAAWLVAPQVTAYLHLAY
jgi:leader peptidase (prepilin peptidase)/N-methyltransferase